MIKLILLIWLFIGFISSLRFIVKTNKSYGIIVVLDIFTSFIIFVLGPICPLIWFIRNKMRAGTTTIPRRTTKLNRLKT